MNPCFVHRPRHRLSACGAIWLIVRRERIKQKIQIGFLSSHGFSLHGRRDIKKPLGHYAERLLYATASFPVPPLSLPTDLRREGSAPQTRKAADGRVGGKWSRPLRIKPPADRDRAAGEAGQMTDYMGRVAGRCRCIQTELSNSNELRRSE
jgi:hypothetical protein